MKNYLGLLLFVIFVSNNTAIAQESKVNISATAGITWRSPAMHIFHFRGIHRNNFQSSYDNERNIQGFSVNPGLRVNYKKIGFEYYPNLRYDVVNQDLTDPQITDNFIKEFIVDHNFNFFVRRKVDYGAGFSIVNTGKTISYVINNNQFSHNIQFHTINAFVAVPIKKVLDLEIKVHFIPNGFHGHHSARTLLYTLRAYREFDSIFRKKKS